MGLALETVDKAISKGFDEAVSNFSTSTRIFVKITNSKIDSIVEKMNHYGDLFVSRKKRIFFTNIQKPERKSIESAVDRAVSLIKLTVPKKDYYGIAQGPFRYKKELIGYDRRIENSTLEIASGIAESCINAATEEGAKKVAGMIFMRYADKELATSKSVDKKWKSTTIRMSLRAFNDITSFQDITASTSISGTNPESFAKDSVRLISKISRTGKIRAGTYDIIYLPSPGGGLISEIDSMAAMGNIETGSVFAKKLGSEVANKSVTLYDDGNMKGAVLARSFDDEGYPTQRTPVIKEGVLANYLHNFSTARKYRTKSTGNAGLINPDPNTPVFEHRKKVKDLERLIGRVDRGILVTNLWYTRFANYITGEFSTMPRDLTVYIEKGEPKFAIKQRDVSSMVGIRISDNVIRMLKNIECAANDTRQTTSWDVDNSYYFMPSIVVRDVQVSVA
ncbi:MAG: TldD/PmbA family protein [Candidatus Micrarchaeales archaeon]